MSNPSHSAGDASYREQALAVVVHRACKSCGAPGVYNDAEWIQQEYTACWVAADDPLMGKPVGDTCPNCNANRGPGLIERLGEVWRRRFVST
jgi:hypothetical protein